MIPPRLLRNPIGFLLLPRFTVIALSSAIEPLRIANRYTAAKYAWRLISMDGAPVPDGNGLPIQPDCSINGAGPLGTLLVCADHDPEKPATRPLVAWLRELDRAGTTLGGIDTGAFTLARAGLLKGRRVTVHWEVIDVFREPKRALAERIFMTPSLVVLTPPPVRRIVGTLSHTQTVLLALTTTWDREAERTTALLKALQKEPAPWVGRISAVPGRSAARRLADSH